MGIARATVFPGGTAKTPLPLLHWLNCELGSDQLYLGKPTKASRARVTRLLREINEASAMLTAFDRENPEFDFFDNEEKALGLRFKRIQALLDDYPKWPTVEVAYEGMRAVLRISDASGRGRPLGEQLAVWSIIHSTGLDQLEMVRQCRCEKWYFARRADQKACSAGCRHKIYEQTDAFKAKRRVYMRDYYKLKQSGKVK